MDQSFSRIGFTARASSEFFTVKRIIVFSLLLVVLVIAGCGTSQKASSQTDNMHKTPSPPEESHPVDTIREIPAVAENRIDTFDISLMLPFYLDSVREIPDTVEVNYFEDSKLAIEFYNGVMIALKELDVQGFPARVHIYDDANSKDRINYITQLADFKNTELIIGPVYNNNLRIMAEYAKHDSIFLVSPLSPAVNITSYNPYYIMVNPSIEVHCRKIFNYLAAHHHDDNVLLFTRPGSNEEKYASIFKNYLDEFQKETNDYSLQITWVTFNPAYGKEEEDIDLNELEAFFDDSAKNVVIVPSVEKSYVHSVGQTLYPLVDPPRDIKDPVKYDITIFGFPVWGEEEGLRLDYLQKLNVHFTSSYFVSPDFYDEKNAFYKNYLDEFHNEPSEYVLKGYDLMKFFGELMKKHNLRFGDMLLTEKINGIHTDFSFGIHEAASSPFAAIDTLMPAPRTDFIENKYVHLLKYEDYSLVKVE